MMGAGGGLLAPFSMVSTFRVGDVATIVPATGWTVPTGQWYLDGAAISGSTGTTYTFLAADLDKAPTFKPSGTPLVLTGSAVAGSLPVFTAAPVLNSVFVGQPVTWSAATATGTPNPSIAYVLYANGAQVATASGSYLSQAAGDLLQVIAKAVTSVTSATSASNTVTAVAASANKLMIDGQPVLVDGQPILFS